MALMRRLQKVDIARSIALIGMVIYHFSWDLAFCGYISEAIPQSRALLALARSVAAAFLFLAGFSLFLAQGRGFRGAAFIRRFLLIAAGAALVSIATWFFMPQDFVYFGILHALAAAAVLGLLFLHTPLWLNGAVIALCFYLPHSGIDLPYPALWGLGLSRSAAPSFDYVPLFPWFAWALAGETMAALMARRALLPLLQKGIKPDCVSRLLQLLGRHSLAFYLLHQPLLLAVLYGVSWLAPPDYNFARSELEQACVASCRQQDSASFCREFCACSFQIMAEKSLLGAYWRGQIKSDDEAVLAIERQCAMQAAAPPPGEARP